MKEKEFIIDKSNEAAYALAETILKTTGSPSYNPAIIYGKSGNGKTHLVNIIKEGLQKRGKNVIVLTVDVLTSKLISSIKNTPNFSITEFCEQFQEADVLIVEDIQYIQERVTTQECLVTMAKYFVKHRKQILFTMNCIPENLELLDEQLRSGFTNSVQIKIKESTELLRTKILENFCKEKGWELSENLKEQIAAAAKTPAEVLGVMKHIMFYVDELDRSLNQELVEKVLRGRKGC